MINKRLLLGGIFSLMLFSCGKEQSNYTKESADSLKNENEQLAKQVDSLKSLNGASENAEIKEQLDTQKAGEIAVEFINYYASTNQLATDLATSNFLKIYRNNEIKIKKSQDEAEIIGEAWMADPARGEKQGIFLGNDYDSKYKFSKILKTEGNAVYLLLKGAYYENTVKMLYTNGEWKVDGAGDLNIPKSLQRD